MQVSVVGIGLMGSQIAAEYALAGHDVTALARDPEAAASRLVDAFRVARSAGLCSAEDQRLALSKLSIETEASALPPDVTIILESVTEDIDLKSTVLGPIAGALPAAIIATNTSSIRISELGRAIGAPDRTVGVHYWNPPLLMPLVEVIAGDQTSSSTVGTAKDAIRSLGKRPIVVKREVPGFIWNRLQFALLREALWLVDQGVASPADVDEVVRDGLARRLRLTGPFETAVLGGIATFERVAASLFPELAVSHDAPTLRLHTECHFDDLGESRRRRDAALADDLRMDRGRPI